MLWILMELNFSIGTCLPNQFRTMCCLSCQLRQTQYGDSSVSRGYVYLIIQIDQCLTELQGCCLRYCKGDLCFSNATVLFSDVDVVLLKLVWLLGECSNRWTVCDTDSVSQSRSAMASVCRRGDRPEQVFICCERTTRANGIDKRCHRLSLVHRKVLR